MAMAADWGGWSMNTGSSMILPSGNLTELLKYLTLAHFIDDLPIQEGDFHSYVNAYQRVVKITQIQTDWIPKIGRGTPLGELPWRCTSCATVSKVRRLGAASHLVF